MLVLFRRAPRRQSNYPNGCKPMPEDPNANRNTAVALSYDESDGAPRVVTKGYGQMADMIECAAREHGLYCNVHEPKELLGLLMQVDLDSQIPPQFYQAVAELLAWLYRLESQEEIPAMLASLPEQQV